MVSYKPQKDGTVINTVKPHEKFSARVLVPLRWIGKTVQVQIIDNENAGVKNRDGGEADV